MSSSIFEKSVTFKNGKTSKNPFAVASLTNCQSNTDGTLNDREFKWLDRRGKGGYGIVNSCCVHVQANGKGWEGEWIETLDPAWFHSPITSELDASLEPRLRAVADMGAIVPVDMVIVREVGLPLCVDVMFGVQHHWQTVVD